LLLGAVLAAQVSSAAASETETELDFGFFHVWYAVDHATRFAFKEKMAGWVNCVSGRSVRVISPLKIGGGQDRSGPTQGSPRWAGVNPERHPLQAGCVTRQIQGLLRPRKDGRFFIPVLTPTRLASRLASKVAGEIRIERTGAHRTRVSLQTDDPKKTDFAKAWLEYLRAALSQDPATRSHLVERSYSVTGDFEFSEALVSAAVLSPCTILKLSSSRRTKTARPPLTSLTLTGEYRRRATWLLDLNVEPALALVIAKASDPAAPSSCAKAYRDIALSREIPAATLAQSVLSRVDDETSSKHLQRFITFIQALPPEIRTILSDDSTWDVLLASALEREESARQRKRAAEDEHLASLGLNQRICEEIRLGRRGSFVDTYNAVKMPSQHAGRAAQWHVHSSIIIKELSPNTYLMGTYDELWVLAVPSELKFDPNSVSVARGILNTEKLVSGFGGTSTAPRLDVACFMK